MLAFIAYQHQGENKLFCYNAQDCCTVRSVYFYFLSQFVKILLDCKIPLKNQELFLAFHTPDQWCSYFWSPHCAVLCQVTDLGETDERYR